MLTARKQNTQSSDYTLFISKQVCWYRSVCTNSSHYNSTVTVFTYYQEFEWVRIIYSTATARKRELYRLQNCSDCITTA